MDEFNFYNSENDGYRGGFGSYKHYERKGVTHGQRKP